MVFFLAIPQLVVVFLLPASIYHFVTMAIVSPGFLLQYFLVNLDRACAVNNNWKCAWLFYVVSQKFVWTQSHNYVLFSCTLVAYIWRHWLASGCSPLGHCFKTENKKNRWKRMPDVLNCLF